MALRLATAPSVDWSGLAVSVMKGLIAENTRLQLSLPQPVYTGDVRQGNEGTFDHLRLVRWRVVVFQERKSVAAFDVEQNGEAQVHAATRVFDRRYAENMMMALDAAALLPEVEASDYELRILEFAGIGVNAVWCAFCEGDSCGVRSKDLFVPFSPEFRKDKECEGEQFWERVEAAARTRVHLENKLIDRNIEFLKSR